MFNANFPYVFKDFALLKTALTVPAPNRQEPDNQRLEFLGDAVLQLLVSDTLYTRYPEADEGVLTDMRIHLVSGQGLLQRIPHLDPAFHDSLHYFNRGKTWKTKAEVDAVEALLGAAWLDGGMEAAKVFFTLLYTDADFDGVSHCTGVSDNPKGELQQYAQRFLQTEPLYQLLRREGPDHAPNFFCSATLNGTSAEGSGSTRKAAEMMAARNLLALLHEATS
ncbi:MAG: ribonuclease III [Kiritimatiellae bacterium]|nr:ribonuclease III [Kiritimatiellia bacterium]MBR5588299.1 ribonuclease III [Kiritimatiellia bacterium]